MSSVNQDALMSRCQNTGIFDLIIAPESSRWDKLSIKPDLSHLAGLHFRVVRNVKASFIFQNNITWRHCVIKDTDSYIARKNGLSFFAYIDMRGCWRDFHIKASTFNSGYRKFALYWDFLFVPYNSRLNSHVLAEPSAMKIPYKNDGVFSSLPKFYYHPEMHRVISPVTFVFYKA